MLHFPLTAAGVAQSVHRRGYGLDDRDQFTAGEIMGPFLFATASRLTLGPAQPPIQRIPGAPTVRVKRPGR